MAKKKHKHEEHENHERWLVSYADFITLLFAFFVVLYSVSRVDNKRMEQASNSIKWAMHFEGNGGVGAPPLFEGPPSEGGCVVNMGNGTKSNPQLQKAIEGMRKKIEKKLTPFLTSQKATSAVVVVAENGRLSIRLAAAHFFDPSRAAVRPESLPVLDAVAGELSSLGRTIRVEGHTDQSPIDSDRFKNNWELSTARSATVTAYLEAAHRIPANRLVAVGLAASHPIANNDTPEGREANRRIEMVVEIPPGDPLGVAVR